MQRGTVQSEREGGNRGGATPKRGTTKTALSTLLKKKDVSLLLLPQRGRGGATMTMTTRFLRHLLFLLEQRRLGRCTHE